MLGPLQLIVIGFDRDEYAHDIVLELKGLRRARTIRLFDLLYVIKHPDGSVSSKEISDLEEEEKREFGSRAETLIGLSAKDVVHADADEVGAALDAADDEFGLSDSQINAIADELPNGSSAIFVIFEHLWARGVKEAMIRCGGYVRAQGLINPHTLMKATDEVAIVLEAIERTETAAMERMADLVSGAKAEAVDAQERAAVVAAEADALVAAAAEAMAEAQMKAEQADQTVEEALAREETARRRADMVVREAEEIEANAVLRAVNALVRAKVLKRAATREALQAIIDARVIEAPAAEKAARAL